ncbi:LysR family transcriptional regulator [Malikia granosa]|uniref:LysR family transcriptional regulator n=1 Tax=Malikia granosa TaxID=263067 RepID=A0A2S9K1M7_9BURK|nr:LysR family transcriptional regulator [Malikia granosa]PRD64350.1 LysR family transcriptional regulator [Malikia granosa]
MSPSTPAARPSRRSRQLPDLQLLEAFVAVCDAGSMALAAQQLGLSQSAVSQSIKTLETELGLQLLDREVRPAVATHAGRVLRERATRLLGQARVLVEQVRASARQQHTQIHLGCVDSFAATVGPRLIRALSGSAQQILMWSGLTPTLTEQLRGRELDFAICTDSAIDDPRIVQRLLFSESWVAVFPKAHPVRALAAARELSALPGALPLIRYSQRSVIGQQIERFLRHIGVQAPRSYEFDATDPLLSLVASGLGWALSTPLCLWQSRQYLDEVVVLPIPATRLGQRHFFLLSREDEWAGLDEHIARVTRDVIRQDTSTAIHRSMPGLPPDALFCPQEETP